MMAFILTAARPTGRCFGSKSKRRRGSTCHRDARRITPRAAHVATIEDLRLLARRRRRVLLRYFHARASAGVERSVINPSISHKNRSAMPSHTRSIWSDSLAHFAPRIWSFEGCCPWRISEATGSGAITCAFSLFVRVDSAPVFHLGARTRPARRLPGARASRRTRDRLRAPSRESGEKTSTRSPSGALSRIAQVRRSRGKLGSRYPRDQGESKHLHDRQKLCPAKRAPKIAPGEL